MKALDAHLNRYLVTQVFPLVTKGFYYLLKLLNLLKPNKRCDL